MTIYSPDEKCIECQRMLTLIPQLNEKAAVSYKACLPCYRNGLARAKKMQLCRNLNDSGLYNETSQQFLEILNLYSQSLQECRAAGDLKMEFSTISEIAQLYFIPASKFRLLAVQNFFANVDAAEVVSQKIIERWSVLSGHTKVEKLLLAVEDASHHDLTLMGMHLLWRIPESQRAQRDAHMWCLIQRMKSRGFAWLMQSSALSARERSMATLEQTSPVGATQFCHWDQLKPIARDSGTDVVFVDWYGALDGPGLSHFPVLLVTSHNGEAPRVWSCGKSWTEVEAVMDKVLVLDHSDLMQKNAKKLLQQLQPLIQPLAQASRPGQTLVFCSIGKMHRIPLHALDLDGEVLIRRNPVVYCSSLAALKVMFESRKLAETRTRQLGSGPQVSTTPWKAALFGGKRSTPEGTKALTTLAKKLNVNPYVDDAFTPWNFSSEIRSGVNLLHYHGHADFEENDPLNQSLIFEDDERFTVSDVYDLSPAGRSYHATLLACGTGMSKTSVSNEVVGLVPAFLYSGAASTVSTLWKFADQDAALFSDLFYEQFDEALKSGQGKRIDLAKALQRAVLRIMEAEDVLYHWAPFVLNGYWMLEVGGE
jgi:CHAT domain-containing protein